MAGFSANQQQFLNTVVRNTGLHPGVVAAWMAAEEPVGAKAGYGGTQNWLNVGITDSGPRGQGNAIWRNPVAAGQATARWIKGQLNDPGFGNAAPGIRAIAGTAGKSPQAQISAIQRSGWAGSGYPDLPGLFRQYAGVKAQSLPAMPGRGGSSGAGGSSSLSVTPTSYRTVTTTGFDQQGYNKALAASIAGNYISNQTDPYAAGQPKTGLNTANPLLASGALSTVTPNPADYQTAQTQLEKIAGKTVTLNQHPAAFQAGLQSTGGVKAGGYTNPLPGAKWERTDMGVDASMPNGAPIRALGDSRVVSIQPGWYKGQPLVKFQLLNGPQAGRFYYIAEAINPTVRPGQTVRTGQTVGTFNSGGTGLELGWSAKGADTLAHATTGYTEGQVTTAGRSFRNFLNGIGARAG